MVVAVNNLTLQVLRSQLLITLSDKSYTINDQLYPEIIKYSLQIVVTNERTKVKVVVQVQRKGNPV